jgi:hypothetical protein
MTENDKTPGPIPSAKRRGRPLRIIAAIILLLGIFGADAVYFLGTRSGQTSDVAAMLGNEKAQARKEEYLYGKQAVLIDNWTNDLKRPGTQALMVVVAGALAAGGCFYFAHLLDRAEG